MWSPVTLVPWERLSFFAATPHYRSLNINRVMLSSTLVDELGYVPLDKAGADLLFGFISQRYERCSLVVTTNLPFARWSEVFLDPTAAAAVIDRIVHHATVLQTSGNSYRLQAAKRNQTQASGKEGSR